jgi:hypothetical protein
MQRAKARRSEAVQYPQGIEPVWGNGCAVVESGQYRPQMAGKVLRQARCL